MCSCLGRQAAFRFEYPKGAETGVSHRARDMTEPPDRDRYGGIVADARLPDGRSLNRVRAGLAWWDRRYSNDPELAGLEAEARAARRGLWADPHPVAPWDWGKKRITAGPRAPAKNTP